MADTKISAMPPASTLDGTEITPIVQAGANKQITTADYVSEVLDVNPVLVSQGGTAATTAAGARTNLAAAHSAVVLTAGVGLSGGGDLTANRTFDIENTGVVAATYGSATKVPVITLNAQGQATVASETTLDPAAINASYFSAYQDGLTTLTAEVTGPSTTTPIQVVSTAGFPTTGSIIIGEEIIGYTTTTATAFGGSITRGQFSSSKSAHAIGAYATEAASSAIGAATSMRLDVVIVSNNITCAVPDSKVYFTKDGIYNIQFSAQFLAYATSIDAVTVWLKKNGNDVPFSASVEEIPTKHGAIPGAVILSLNFMDSFDAGDYVELYWSSLTGETVLATYPNGTSPTRPASPSLIFTVAQIA
jgi:hypothetical protein